MIECIMGYFIYFSNFAILSKSFFDPGIILTMKLFYLTTILSIYFILPIEQGRTRP